MKANKRSVIPKKRNALLRQNKFNRDSKEPAKECRIGTISILAVLEKKSIAGFSPEVLGSSTVIKNG
jgi:hypothetical protein